MKKITMYLLLLCAGVVFGQSPATLSELSGNETYVNEMMGNRSAASVTSGETRMLGGLQVFSDRATYIAQCDNGTNLVLEDFTGGPTALLGCDTVLSSAGDSCFPAGELEEGFEITVSDPINQTIYIDPADGFGNLDPAVGSNTFLDFTIINFTGPDPVTSFGFDLYSLLGGSNIDVRVFGTSGLLETVVVDVTSTGPVFVGIISTEEIVSVELEDLTLADVEVISQFLFGSCAPPPLNDDPVTAADLTVGVIFPDFPLIAENTDATASEVADPSIPAPTCGNYGGGDLWYTATVPASGKITFETQTDDGSISDTGMTVYEGAIGSLVQVACNDDGGPGLFSLINLEDRTPGEVLYLRVWEWGGNAVGTFQVAAYDTPPPPNDDLDGVIELTVGAVFADFPELGTNVSATASEDADPSIPAPACGNYGGGDIWYSVVVPSTGNITIETNRIPTGAVVTDTGMSIYEGTIGALVEVECDDDDSADGFFSLVALTGRTPGEVLYVRVWEWGNNAFGDFQTAAYSDCPVQGGDIELANGGTDTVVCLDTGADAVDATLGGIVVGTNSQWVITDTAGVILGLPAPPPFDLTSFGVGTVLLWHLSFEDGLTGATVGESASNLAGCFDLSNPITVEIVDEGGPCEVCDYTLQMFDSFGDGWNGAFMDVLVDGQVVLDDVSLDTDPANNGSAGSLSFPIFGGADVTTVMLDGGGFPGEITYNILDSDGNIVASGDVDNDVVSGTVTASCPACPAPSNVTATNASTTSVDVAWDASPVAVDYNWEIQNAGTPQGDPSAIATGTTANTAETIAVTLVGGSAYTFFVQSNCDSEGVSTFISVDFIVPASNDECDNAIALVCGETVTGNTSVATDSGLNPSADVFYSYTGSGIVEDVTISLCDGGTLYDSLLRVFDDGCALVSEIVFNDDSCGLQSELTFQSDGTTTYTIMVEGFATAAGEFSLATTCEEVLNVNDVAFEGFTMYPNPASTVLNLDARNNIENITIVNVMGQQVLTRNVQASNTAIDVSGLSSGAYFIRVAIDGNQSTYKFIKN